MDYSDMNALKPKQIDDNVSSGFETAWQMQLDPAMGHIPTHLTGGMSNSERSSSLSPRHTSSPNDEIFQQLFPGIDVNSNMFDSTGTSQGFGGDGNDKNMASNSAGSTPLEFGPTDEILDFTSQPWADSSMSVPDDTFTCAYDLNQEFTNPDFTANWTQ